MTYEVAKQLKDAGFPQRFNRGAAFNAQGVMVYFTADKQGKVSDTDVSIPSLNELIKACGDKFGGLEHFPDESSNKFRVFSRPDGALSFFAHTPEEAVAKLWLLLNKKENE